MNATLNMANKWALYFPALHPPSRPVARELERGLGARTSLCVEKHRYAAGDGRAFSNFEIGLINGLYDGCFAAYIVFNISKKLITFDENIFSSNPKIFRVLFTMNSFLCPFQTLGKVNPLG